jgi:hypothetical protein
MKTAQLLSALFLCAALTSCDNRPAHDKWVQRSLHPGLAVAHKVEKCPIYKVSKRREIAYDANSNLWFWLYVMNNNSVEVVGYSRTAPENWTSIAKTAPIASIKAAALEEDEMKVIEEKEPTTEEVPENVQEVENSTENVSEAEVSAWENEGGSLGGETSESSGSEAGDSDASSGDSGGGDSGGGDGGGGGD